MKLQKIDHIGINVNDLAAAKAFFLDFGLKVQSEWSSEGAQLDLVVGLKGVKTDAVMLTLPDGKTNLELVKYRTPVDENGVQNEAANVLGIRHLAFVVDDLEAVVADLKTKGHEVFSEIQTYDNGYKLCYVRGPEQIILELAEETK